ncbi:hypothetical protein [Nocardia terpenica]|uniref:Uncharacterized protein n=1 Tax=Nocardia terpenica TaxID=455432 RepID=A0A164H0N4_9NOCA|nr:hypothetical protein [Nocardia terpenica]KZM68103.1 hypothetical protein AWN90_09180 [Nocardia terpenica]NQE89040.1 hypothetical protein [Nocardia terpenica]
MDTFLAAVRADSASDDAEVDATAVADLLGVQVTTLLDRIQAPTRRELTASGSAASRLTWPSLTGSPYRCIRDCEHTPRLIDRIRHSLHLY